MFRIFKHIRQRCYNKNNSVYYNYGGRGITVCDRWKGLGGFDNFCKDMGEKPTPKHSIDRIDVNGNYEPSNCRWANPHEQASNTRTNNKNVGVCFMKHTRNTWRAEITVSGIRYRLHFNTEEDAIEGRKLLEKLYLKY